jgi:PAS domain S-box-containing protein
VNPVGVIDLVALFSITVAASLLILGWRRGLDSDTRILLAGLLFLTLFHAISNSLEWGGITAALDPFEDYVQLLEPGLWFAVAYSFLQHRGRAKLRESQEQLLDLYENAPAAYFSVGVDGSIRRCNLRTAEFLGYRVDQLTGRPVTDLYADTPHGKAAVASVFERFHAGETIVDQELQMQRADGTSVWTSLTVNAVRNEDGDVVESRSMVVDITARRQAEQEKQAMEAHLRQSQKFESIGTLASGVAHELNNPLTSVINYAQRIHDRVGDAKMRDYAAGIIEEGDRMAEIVSHLLSFTWQEMERHSPASLRDIVDKALSLIRATLRNDQIRVEVDIPSGLPRTRCQSQQIQQVLMNLLTNARDALNSRYPEFDENKVVRITAELAEDGAWVRTTVEDHGTGIATGLLGRVFDPFFTTKPRDRGTGIGLTISHRIVQDHGGRLVVESEPGAGTRVTMDLPIDVDENE